MQVLHRNNTHSWLIPHRWELPKQGPLTEFARPNSLLISTTDGNTKHKVRRRGLFVRGQHFSDYQKNTVPGREFVFIRAINAGMRFNLFQIFRQL